MTADQPSATWGELVRDAPDFADTVLNAFRAHAHHVIATIRSDGSPRVGGTNVYFTDEHMWVGAMPNAQRVRDLVCDPRCSIHSAPLDEHLVRPDVQLDAISQLADVEISRQLMAGVTENSGEGRVFLLRVRQVRLLRVGDENLWVETWTPKNGRVIRQISQ